MNQLEVRIMGQGYLLGCPEGGEARLQQAVHRVDAAMCAIRDAGKLKARDRIAVLAALNLAFELDVQQATALPGSGAGASDLPATPGGPRSSADEAALTALLSRLDETLAAPIHQP